MEPWSCARVLLVELVLVLSCVPAPCAEAVPASERSGTITKRPDVMGGEQWGNLLQIITGCHASGPECGSTAKEMATLAGPRGLPGKDSGNWLNLREGLDGISLERSGAGGTGALLDKNWGSDRLEPGTKAEAKRSTVVADDMLFREKSKLLAALERQQWLKSMLSRLLVT